MTNVSLVVFPGSNCDHDIQYALAKISGVRLSTVWHSETDLRQPDLVILPGGFSFGDYLRTGALAKISPVMGSVKAYAERGGQVLGICNGFQILCEAGLLPGVLIKNRRAKFLSQFVYVKLEESQAACVSAAPLSGTGASSTSTCSPPRSRIARWPIAHGEGNYYCSAEVARQLKAKRQIAFSYCNEQGEVHADSWEHNPNGSFQAIAGICNEHGNVCGLMPHPERVVDSVVSPEGDASGLGFFSAYIGSLPR